MLGALPRLWLTVAAVALGGLWGLSARSWLLGGFVVVTGALLIGWRRRPPATVVGLVFVAAGLTGTLGAARSHDTNAVAALARNVPRCTFAGRILEQAGGLGTLASADRLECADQVSAGIVMIEGAERLPSGARIDGTGWLLPLGGESFDDARRRLGARGMLDPVDMRVRPPESFALRAAAGLRAGLTKAAKSTDDREGSLLVGLTIGDTSGFDRATIDSFRRTGLAHLLAVSGSNVAMVLASVALITQRLAYRVRLALGSIVLALFVLIVGPDPSVMRAALMGAITMFALGWVRRVDPLHSLAVALLVILALRPAMVASVGLHLSSAATLGIVLWAKPLARALSFLPAIVAVPLGLTLAAQAAVAPILIATFGEVSVVAPMTNLLAAPAVWLATLGGLTAAALSPLSEVMAGHAVRLISPALAWILAIADRADRLAWASTTVSRPFAWLAGSILVVALALTLRRRIARPS